MKSCLVLISTWLLVGVLAAHAQKPKPIVDSLRQLLQTQTKPDTMRVRRLQKLGQSLTATDPAQARATIKQALKLSQDLGYTRGEGRALLWLGTIARREADYEQARRHVREAQQVFAHSRNWRGQGESYLELMLIEMMQGNNASAIVAAQQGIPLAEKADDAQTKRRLQATLGSIYLNLEDYKAALPILQAALKNGEQAGDKQVMMVMQNALGTLYTKQKNWASALHYFERAQQLAIGEHDDLNRTIDEINMADVYRLQGNYQQARFYGLRARARAVAGNDGYSLPFAELLLAQVYQAVHQPDSAIMLANKSLERARQTRSKENIRDVSLVLAQAYAERREFAPAYRYQGQYLAYNDTLTGEQTQRQTAALRYGYELDKKQAQIALLTKTRQLQDQRSARQRQQLYGLLAGLGSVVLVAGLLWRNVLLKQRANQRLNEKNEQIAGQRDALDRTLMELKATQTQLIQKEKMASLGELTAGIAHEIQNPLNFVNNFAEVSVELLDELEEEQQRTPPDPELAQDLLTDIRENLQKINHHGRRADAIVRGMLAHSNHAVGEKKPTKLNALTEEYLRLAYQGWRAKDKSFMCDLQTDFSESLDKVAVVPQEIGRVLVNLFSNAFYATQQRTQQEGNGYQPRVSVQTRQADDHVEIRVRDNGTGIPEPARTKIFQPFFTTKPTGQGTGLGLSLSYDIVTKGHGGQISVESELGRYTEFVVQLPA